MIPIEALINFWNFLWPILVAILVFMIIIMIHEFGHFIFAKILGVKVNEYAIGFGPTILKWQGKETKYSLRLVPFGGFCAMEGEDESSDNPRGFCNKKPWRRLIIILAGAAFNIILGFVLVLISLSPNKLLATTQIAEFINTEKFTSVSNNYGLQVNDTIVNINGRDVYTTIDMAYAFSGEKDGMVDMVVIRDGKRVTLKDVKFSTQEIDGVTYIISDFYVYGKENNFGNLIVEAGKETFSYSRVVWFSVIDLVSGRYGISQVSGPVGVTAVITDAVKVGIPNLLPIMAIITINLGIFNLLPIPALDGSRALFILIEMIFRKPVPRKYESVIHAVGLVVLLGFMAIVTLKDILSFF